MSKFVLKNRRQMQPNVSERLKTLLELTDPCHTIADIGCDHGKLCQMIIRKEVAKQVIASDISEKSLKKARKLFDDATQVPEFRVGSGLQVLEEGEAQGIIIAGMGGRLIVSILEEGWTCVAHADWILCQPMQQTKDLRHYLRKKDLAITEERVIFEENRYYEIIKIEPHKKACYPKEIDLFFCDEVGPRLWEMNSLTLRNKLKRECNALRRRLSYMISCETVQAQTRREFLEQQLEKRIQALRYLEKKQQNDH